MYWLHFNLCLIVLALLTPHIVSGDESRRTNLNGEEEALPLEQTVDLKDGSNTEPNQADRRRLLRQSSFMPNSNSNMRSNAGFQFPQGLVPNLPYIGQPIDAQESSASNKVVLVLDNDKNKFPETVQPAEESLKRFARNPDAIDDILGQFQQFGGGMTQQLLQQVSQTAPDISKSFGQALSEALAQTNLLAQVPPVNSNFTQIRGDSSQSNLPGSMDLGLLGQNFLLGATQNLFNPIRNRADSEVVSDNEASPDPGRLGAAAPGAEVETAQGADADQNPFVGHPFFPHFRPLPQFKPFGMFSHFPALRPLLPSASDISEVRVLPEQYSPYKVSPKQVDLQTMAELRLRAVLKEALTKKTIPILWFHLPTNRKLQKDKEDVEMETKLQVFEQQVIAELKQLQDLASMANEVKKAQLQSGAQPTASLTTKLNLFEIPIYDITLGDIEKTLKDEHVMMLMQTLVQKNNKEFQRHQQATTKYLTDLTGTPIKREVKSSEDILKTMEKDDMMKMMSYAYRMASMNGHEMPWLKKVNMTSFDDQGTTKGSRAEEQQKQQLKAASTQMNDERKWLEDKHQRMAIEEAKQRQLFSDVQRKMDPNAMPHWAAMMQQQIPRQRQMMPAQMQQQMPVQTQMMSPQMQQQMPVQAQMMSPQAQHQMPVQTQMVPAQMQQQVPAQAQMMSPQMQQQMPVQAQIMSPQAQQQMPVQTQVMPAQMQQQVPVQTQVMPAQMQQQMVVERQMLSPQMQHKMPAQAQVMPAQMQQQVPVQTQMMSPQTQQQMPVHTQVMPAQMQQQVPVQTQMMSPQTQQQMPVHTQVMPAQMQQQMVVERQMMSPQMQHKMPVEMQMMPPQIQQPMPVGNQMMPAQMQQQMAVEKQMMSTQMQQKMPVEMQMMPPQTQQLPVENHMTPMQMQQQDAEGRQMMFSQNQMFDFNMPIQHQETPRQIMPLPMQQRNQMFETEMQIQNTPRQMMQQQMFDSEMRRQDNPMLQQQQQRMMTNFDTEPPMLMERQQQQLMMEMQRMAPEMLKFQPNSVDMKMPEMKSETEQKSEPGTKKQIAETKMPEKTTSFNAEKITKTEPTATFEKSEQLTDEKQNTEAKSPLNQASKDMNMDKIPTITQMPENDGKARFKGIDHILDPLGLFNHRHHHIRKGIFRPPLAYNYYHNPSGSHYPPIYAPPPQIYGNPHHSYHHAHPSHYHYHPSASRYGYSSSYGGYRAATGDEEIAAMLRQHQQEQSNPKMMMPNNDEFTTTTTATRKKDKSNAEHLIKNQPKRLAKKHTKRIKSPAAYIIVVRNNHSSKSGRSRRKRSADFTTLEPIDENSLTALRKVYKNSLKEITLNPNETPAEALMRYNAESIREALEKANKQPMEIMAGKEGEEIKDNKAQKIMEHQDILQQQISKPLTHDYALRHSGQFVPVPTRPENPASNGPYIILPAGMQQTQTLPVSFKQQPVVVYDHGQETVYNNMISKYNTPAVYSGSNKFLTQNPFIPIHNPVETVPFVDEYGVVNQPYQLADQSDKDSKFIVYQKSDAQPYSMYNEFIPSSNAINKNPQYFPTSGYHMKHSDKTNMWQYENFVGELPTTKADYSVPHVADKNDYIDAYTHMKQPPTESTNIYRSARSQESSPLESIIALIKEQLVQCCDTCKDDILKRLDATLKHQHLEKSIKPYNTFIENPYNLKYNKPSNHREFEYKQWLVEMAEKGYDKAQLTKQHQTDYLKDGKLKLHVNEQRLGHEVEQIFFKNNQSSKRKTNVFEAAKDSPIASFSRIAKMVEDEEEEVEEDAEMAPEEDQTESKAENQNNNEGKTKKTISTLQQLKSELTPVKEKNNSIDKKDRNRKENPQNSNTNKTIQAAESTTHSVYALRGQFRSRKAHPMPFTLKQGKQFDNFKNINKLGTTNIFTKSNEKENTESKNDKLEEILEILFDLSKHNNKSINKEALMEQNSSTTISSSYAGNPYPLFSAIKASADENDSKTFNAANIVDKPRKLIRRRIKNRKMV